MLGGETHLRHDNWHAGAVMPQQSDSFYKVRNNLMVCI